MEPLCTQPLSVKNNNPAYDDCIFILIQTVIESKLWIRALCGREGCAIGDWNIYYNISGHLDISSKRIIIMMYSEFRRKMFIYMDNEYKHSFIDVYVQEINVIDNIYKLHIKLLSPETASFHLLKQNTFFGGPHLILNKVPRLLMHTKRKMKIIQSLLNQSEPAFVTDGNNLQKGEIIFMGKNVTVSSLPISEGCCQHRRYEIPYFIVTHFISSANGESFRLTFCIRESSLLTKLHCFSCNLKYDHYLNSNLAEVILNY